VLTIQARRQPGEDLSFKYVVPVLRQQEQGRGIAEHFDDKGASQPGPIG
jgi:hypothetical protein